MPSYAVIFRTHVWDDDVAALARQAQACCGSGMFVVAADETRGPLSCDGFTKLPHDEDFSRLGLPKLPEGKVLWWNADYVLYAARQAMPEREFYIMLEYDVYVNCDLDRMIETCARHKVGFAAQDLAPIGQHWSAPSASELGIPVWWALIPFVVVSRRVVDVMLRARQLMAAALAAGQLSQWPYCEPFMPSAAALLRSEASWPLNRLTDTKLLNYRPFISLRDPKLRQSGIVAHPVMRGVRYIKAILNEYPMEGFQFTDGRLRADLQGESLEDLQAAFGDGVTVEKTAEGEWAIAAAAPEIFRPWVDLAAGRPATQSSHSVWSRGATVEEDAAFAVRDPMPEEYAFHTDTEEDPWWQVDLGQVAGVERIEIINRTTNGHNFNRFRIDISRDGVAWETCFSKLNDAIVSSDSSRPARVTLPGQVQARFLRIVQLGKNVMHLRRVRVLGFWLSSADDNAGGAAETMTRLIDERVNRETMAETIEAFVHERVFGRGFDSYDLDKLAVLAAGIDSSLYAAANMTQARKFADAGALHDFAADGAPHRGLVLEFGVFSGTSINRIAARMPGRRVHGFDSFEGLPEAWRPGFEQGAFQLTERPAVAANVELVVGWFDRTLPDFAAAHPGETLALLHVDCDLYSSTKTIFEIMGARVVPGTVIVFDEYFNYPEWRLHEFKAFAEFVAARRIVYDYIGYVPRHQQVAVRVTRIG